MLKEKTSWLLLAILFTFDNIISYWAIAYKGGHEGNLLIAGVVEKYPLLYFLCIPLTLVIMLGIAWLIEKTATFILKKLNIKNLSDLRKIIVGAMVVYWVIANSSINAVFLTGYRIEIEVFTKIIWPLVTGVGILAAFAYSIFLLNQSNRISKNTS